MSQKKIFQSGLLIAILLLVCQPQAKAQTTKYKVQNISITCSETTESGEDEVFLLVSIDGGAEQRYPGNGNYVAMNEGSKIATWEVPYQFEFASSCVIKIMEDDDVFDDEIGKVTISTGAGKNLSQEFKDGHQYKIVYTKIALSPTTVAASGQPFRLVFNGIRCMNTTDEGEDEVYLNVQIDNKPAFTVKADAPYVMNERASGAFQEFWDDYIVGAAKKEYWLLPGSWYVTNQITIKIMEDDDSPNPDDHIGTITVSAAEQDGFEYSKEFTSEGHYFASYTKTTTKPRLAGFQSNYSIMDKVNNSFTDAVANQGTEGACVAFTVTSAVATKVINSVVGNNNSSADKQQLANLSTAMFDAFEFYKWRNALFDAKDGLVKQRDGWWNDSALMKAMAFVIPFKNNRQYGISLKNYEAIKDGYVYDNRWVRKTFSTTPVMSQADRMRSYFHKKEALIADFTVYEDFYAYVKTNKVYGGKIYNQRIGKDYAGHAVMLSGYTCPDQTSDDPEYWEVQNSWGPKWGDNGFCKMAVNALGIDDIVYAVGDWGLYEVATGVEITDAAKKRSIIRQVLGLSAGSAEGALTGVGNITGKLMFIQNMWKPDVKINVEKSQTVEAGPIQNGAWSSHWKLVPVPNSTYYWIVNRWREGERINIEKGTIDCGKISDNAWSAHWKIVPLDNGAFRIENRWYPEKRLHIENGKLECASISDGANSAYWLFKEVE